MSFRYWLVVPCVVLSLATLCTAVDNEHYLSRAHAGRLNHRMGWRARQQSRWPLYRRDPYRPINRLYPRWPLANSDPHSLRVRWPNGRPRTPPAPNHAQQTPLRDATPRRPDTSRGSQESSRHSENQLRREPLVSSLRLSEPQQGRGRTMKQLIWPRKYFSASGTGSRQGATGGTQPQTCSNGKVWRRGACVCPYLSNWNAQNNQCECVYGTYRHTSGHCYRYN